MDQATKRQILRHLILTVGIDAISMTEAVAQVMQWTKEDSFRFIATANAEMVMKALSDPMLWEALHQADLVVPDGAGVVWAGERLGIHFPERVAGIDLMTALVEALSRAQVPFYFLGGRPRVAALAKTQLESRFGTLSLVGLRDGYGVEEAHTSIIDEIRRSKAKVVFVGMGVPLQEHWIQRARPELDGVIAMGVGGSFDVLSGEIKRAPLWMQRHRLEWLYRLSKEPTRIRRMSALPRFMARVYQEQGKQRRKKG